MNYGIMEVMKNEKGIFLPIRDTFPCYFIKKKHGKWLERSRMDKM